MIRLGARARPRHFALITAHSVTVTLSHTIIVVATERAPTVVQYIDPREIFILVPKFCLSPAPVGVRELFS